MSAKHHLIIDGQTWPYTISISKRAKYLRVKLSAQGDINVVLPVGVAESRAHSFIRSQQSWLQVRLASIGLSQPIVWQAPHNFDLELLEEVWRIEIYQTTSPDLSLEVDSVDQRLRLTGNVTNEELFNELVGSWLKRYAKPVLNKRLQFLAEQHGFSYRRLSVRLQKTRWGSCSLQKNINLNARLLFLKEPLVDYVLIHELCHTLEMNHSRRFWNLVADCDPEYQIHRQAIRAVEKSLPI